jgi:pimeloyl-ACP methyl ester carboxylesterase
MISPFSKGSSVSRTGMVVGAAVLTGLATAAWVESRARRAQRDNPPTGKMVEVDGVRLHYVERGEGPPVVLIHGNTVWHRDFVASDLFDRLAQNHRVIAFDRPGFGHSTRPRDRLWTPTAQAALLHAALGIIRVGPAVVVGHSMGAMVGMAMALDYPATVSRLVLLGGYYYPNMRVDAMLTAPVALPVLGDVMRYTVTALTGRLMIDKLVKGMFAPRDLPPSFLPLLSREMMLRPIQIRANAEDAAFMIGQAKASSRRHHELQMPVAILVGAEDMVVDVEEHSARLHADLPQSVLIVVPGAGHMVHHAATDRIVAAIDGDSTSTEPGAPALEATGRMDLIDPEVAMLEAAA